MTSTILELTQWALIITLGVLVLAMYAKHAPKPLTENGPAQGRALPRDLIDTLNATLPDTPSSFVLAFVTDSCPACRRIIDRLESNPDQSHDLILVANRSREGFVKLLHNSSLRFITLKPSQWEDCQVRATPLFVTVREGRVVEKGVHHELAGAGYLAK